MGPSRNTGSRLARHSGAALVIWLTGWAEFETTDGEKRRCEPGAVVLAEDTSGKGHITRGPGEGQFLIFVPLPEGLSGDRPSEGIKRLDFIH